ncbi:PREDICTED: probable disease resistance RPP8-like protein 4 [Ipomoea nil]|uniref:probable disease resistance RPP8-like protein 4 n=1 Tax=Ipomoea nil TaxID=35883 RepID=UPI000900FCC7|nr:PREDICTED: probable disease resistance RPP8-like protein 4 [Ipomoea nil]
MAEILLTAAIMKAIDVCNDLVGEEGSAFKHLRENIHWMERQLRHMQSYLEIAEARKGHDRRAANLVEDIEELAGDVEDTLETFLPHVDSHLSFPCRIFPNFSAVHKFSVKIETIKKRIKDIDDDRKTYGITMDTTGSRGSQKWDARRAYLLLADEPEVRGLDEDCEQLEARLRDQRLDFGVVSIVGMPGLGKTNACKEDLQERPKIRDLLGDIARQVGLTEEQIKKNPETNLYSFLQQRRYIILFDEIWDFESWDAIKYCIPTAKNGSRIIITSRNNSVGRYIGGQHSLHTLQPLDREKSWELFSKQITSSSFEKMTTLPEELKSVGEQIVEKCGGVPLAIVVTAGVLRARERSENEWKQVLNNIGQDDEDEWSRVLALSYEDLPTRLKHCFLYFGLFPEGYEIKALDLMNMWIAEKLVEQPSNEEEREIEDVAEGYLNNLIARNLIQVSRSKYNGKIKSCRIHDILRSSLCVKIGKKSKFCSVLGAKGARRVASNAKTITDNVKPNSETSKLRVLMCSSAEKHNGKEKELLKCISSFKLLRVLSLEFDRDCTLTCFPNEFWNLIHLTYFRLRVSDLVIPSSIRNLKNLLTLNIRGCGEVSIHPSFWKMKQLRHVLVDMENWRYKGTNRDRSIISSTSVSLENLRTLEWVSIEIIQLAGVQSLSRLRRLGIYSHFGQKIEQLFSSMPPLENLEKLSLSFIYPANIGGMLRLNLSGYHSLLKLRIKGCLFKLPNVDAFPPNLVKLCLFYTKMDEDPMKILKRLPKLKFLKLIDGYGGLSVMDFSGAGSFPQLQVLHI